MTEKLLRDRNQKGKDIEEVEPDEKGAARR
jgi:hypothetical protein